MAVFDAQVVRVVDRRTLVHQHLESSEDGVDVGALGELKRVFMLLGEEFALRELDHGDLGSSLLEEILLLVSPEGN